MSVVRFDRTGERCIVAFDIFICLLNFLYSELKLSGAIVYPTIALRAFFKAGEGRNLGGVRKPSTMQVKVYLSTAYSRRAGILRENPS